MPAAEEGVVTFALLGIVMVSVSSENSAVRRLRRFANVLLRPINDVSPSGGDCVQKLAALVYQTHWGAEVAIVDCG